MTGRGGALWQAGREHKRAVVTALAGARARVRYSLDGSLDQQATIEGVVHVRPGDLTIFHVQRDRKQHGDRDRTYTAVIYSRVIDVTALPGTSSAPTPKPEGPRARRQNDDRCQGCLGMYQPPGREGIPSHCGRCWCCREPRPSSD